MHYWANVDHVNINTLQYFKKDFKNETLKFVVGLSPLTISEEPVRHFSEITSRIVGQEITEKK